MGTGPHRDLASEPKIPEIEPVFKQVGLYAPKTKRWAPFAVMTRQADGGNLIQIE